MTTVCNESNSMPFGARYLCEEGIELAVADVGYWTVFIGDGVAIYGAQCLNGTEIAAAIGFQPRVIMLRTEVARAMSGVIDNDVVTPLNFRVVDETVERVDNVGAGRCQGTTRGRIFRA